MTQPRVGDLIGASDAASQAVAEVNKAARERAERVEAESPASGSQEVSHDAVAHS